MSRELFVSHTIGTTVYAVVRVPLTRSQGAGGNIGMWWNTNSAALEYFAAGNWADYAVSLAELGATGFFEGDMPAVLPERAVEVYFFVQGGVGPVQGDTKICGALFEHVDEWVATGSLRI